MISAPTPTPRMRRYRHWTNGGQPTEALLGELERRTGAGVIGATWN